MTKKSKQTNQHQDPHRSHAEVKAMVEHAIVTAHRLNLEVIEVSEVARKDDCANEQLQGLVDELCDCAPESQDGKVVSQTVGAIGSRVAEALHGLNDRELRTGRSKVDGRHERVWRRAKVLDALTTAIADAERAMRAMHRAVDAVVESMSELRWRKTQGWTMDADADAVRQLARADGAGGVIDGARRLDAGLRKSWPPANAGSSGLTDEDEVVRQVLNAANVDTAGVVEAAVVAAVRRSDKTTDDVERLLRMDRMLMIPSKKQEEEHEADAGITSHGERGAVAAAVTYEGGRWPSCSVAAVVKAAVAVADGRVGDQDEAKKRMLMGTIAAWALWRRPTTDHAAVAASMSVLTEHAALCGETAVEERLVDRCGPVDDRSRRHRLMCELAGKGDVEALDVLLDGGIPWEPDKLVAVMKAAMHGPGCGGDEVRTLMRRRDMQDAVRGNEGFVASCCAAGAQELRMANRLAALLDGEFAGCVRVNEQADGSSVLHWCARRGWHKCVRVLVQAAGVDVNAQDAGGRAPLHLAARGGHVQAARALIEVGRASVHVATSTNAHTPLDYAVKYCPDRDRCDAVVELLEAHGVRVPWLMALRSALPLPH